MEPSAELDSNLNDGVVADKVLVEELEPEAEHGEDSLDEDDAFLGSATAEVWDYDVVDARAREFEEAIENSDLVLEYDVVDTTVTSAEDAAGSRLKEGSVYPPDGPGDGLGGRTPERTGGGRRNGDEYPSGFVTGDPTAGGLSNGNAQFATDAEEVIREEMDEGDDLNLQKASDPRLGLTNRGTKPAQDWAANTGPSRNPARGVESDTPRDDASSLGPGKRKPRN